ncbi:MAG: EGF domain-containing protein, partial [Myxococcota bacterium]
NTAGGFMCACNAGYAGDGTTCTDIDECTAMTDTCDANAACENTAGGFTCTCNSGFSGDGVTCAAITPDPGGESPGTGNDDDDGGCAASTSAWGWLAFSLLLRRRKEV